MLEFQNYGQRGLSAIARLKDKWPCYNISVKKLFCCTYFLNILQLKANRLGETIESLMSDSFKIDIQEYK